MRKFFAVALLTLAALPSSAQIPVKDRVKTIKPITKVDITPSAVTLYENANYTGAFKTLAPGQYVLSDFNDVASSIKVPPGMVAYIYEHATPTQGYGISVDLMEDVPDLSVYNFNDKVSYVTVFYASRDNQYDWVRNAMNNGQFVSGHWERKRANPLPPNTVAVVSPPIAGPLPTTPSVLTINGPNTIISSLGIMANEAKAQWDMAMNQQLGVIGNDYRGIDTLGSACFERASNNLAIPDNLNFWYPQKQKNDHRSVVYFKRTLVGTLDKVGQFIHSGTYEDYDMNIDIKPDPNYMYLLTDAHGPEYTTLMKSQYYGSFGYSGESGCPDRFEALEAEISDRDNAPDGYKSKIVQLNEGRVGQKLGVYGTWIYDAGHCCHPEIHPAEQIWWNEQINGQRIFNLNVICDASNRYLYRIQMDDGSKIKPWGEPPVRGLFAIAFEYTINDLKANAIGQVTKQFEVSNIQDHNVIEYPNADQTYNLVYNGRNIISFVPHNDAFKVSFENVGISAEDRNKIRGFLVIETSVGTMTQVATELTNPMTGTQVKIPEGAKPWQVPEIMEPMFFKKVSGFYYFTLTEKNLLSGGVIKEFK